MDDDELPGIRWRLPRQSADWLAMTGNSTNSNLRTTERYRAGQGKNDYRPGSSRLGSGPCPAGGQCPPLRMDDDRLPGIRWRLPRQCAHWLAMTGNLIARQIPIYILADESRNTHYLISHILSLISPIVLPFAAGKTQKPPGWAAFAILGVGHTVRGLGIVVGRRRRTPAPAWRRW